MSSAFDSNWYRIAPIRPRLRRHAELHRVLQRRRVWYVLQDNQSGRHFRVSAAAGLVLCLMDGTRSVQEIWRRLAERLGAERPSRGEIVRLLVQLHQSDMLVSPLPPDMAELDRRSLRQVRRRRLAAVRNPLALRLPLWDPDGFLAATESLVLPLLGRAAGIAWLVLVAVGIILAAMHWSELTANVGDRVFAARNVILIAALYPIAKILHEAGHAYMVRSGGGEVHEVGIMLLVMFPVPYVDASAANGFPSRGRRMLVSAAGILVELAIASLAMIAWTLLQPGAARSAAFSLMVICSVSTLLFNGNPLLRFDGYYVFGDLIGVPNLDQRGKRYLLYLLKRHVLGMADAQDPAEVPGEAARLAIYGITAALYRIGVGLGVAAIVATKLFAIGIALAGWTLVQMALLPLVRATHYVLRGRDLHGRRLRALAGAGALLGLVALVLFGVPVRDGIVTEGVVSVPDQAVVRAGADGFVDRLAVRPGQAVKAGQTLFGLEDPVARSQIGVLQARVAVFDADFHAANLVDRVQAALSLQQRQHAEQALQLAEQRVAGLISTAARAGTFLALPPGEADARFVHKGDILGYVLDPGDVSVDTVVPEAEADRVRRLVRRVDIRFTGSLDRVVQARIVNETPSAIDHETLPGMVAAGGGPVTTDPTSPGRDRPIGTWFAVKVAPAGPIPSVAIGGHAFVCFTLAAEPIAWRLFRRGRALAFEMFHV